MGDQIEAILQTWIGLQPAESGVIYSPTEAGTELLTAALSFGADRLCLLNWNIAKNNHRQNWQQELGAIARTYNPQLFFFQEARLDLQTPDSQ